MNKFGTAQPYAATFVILLNDKSEILLVKRATTGWMDGYYGLPSGKVENGEGFLAAAIREAKEEVGIVIAKQDLEFKVAMWRHEDDDQDIEWVDMFFEATAWEQEPYNAEPEVHSEIAWFPLADLPSNTIPAVRQALEAFKQGESYFEKDDFRQPS